MVYSSTVELYQVNLPNMAGWLPNMDEWLEKVALRGHQPAVCTLLLWVLLLLQFFWFAQLVKCVHKVFTEGELHDHLSDSEGEGEDEDDADALMRRSGSQVRYLGPPQPASQRSGAGIWSAVRHVPAHRVCVPRNACLSGGGRGRLPSSAVRDGWAVNCPARGKRGRWW